MGTEERRWMIATVCVMVGLVILAGCCGFAAIGFVSTL